jgi:Tfp pilus assembly protein PilE
MRTRASQIFPERGIYSASRLASATGSGMNSALRVHQCSPLGTSRMGTTRTRTIHRSRGFTLIECIVYVAAFFVVLGLAMMTYYRVEENSRSLRRNATDILRTVQAGERWREDIRRAIGPIQVAGAGEGQTFTIPQTNGAVQYAFREGTVWRQAGAQNLPALVGVLASSMAKDPRQRVTAWRWEVELKGRQKVARVRPLFTFEAPNREEKR